MSQTASRCFGAGHLTLVLAAMCVTLAGHVRSTPSKHNARHVREGQSIQSAIDAAHHGDSIFVEAGTYAEQLTITTDGIALIGSDAVLVPPAIFSPNTCSGLAGNDTEAGICVTGSNVSLDPYVAEHRRVTSVGRRIRDVLITGFHVRGFSGENIALVGAHAARVARNTLTDGGQYGFLSAGSTHTRATANTVSSTDALRPIAMCIDDLAGSAFVGNVVAGYFVGLCVQTPGADVRGNRVTNACVGAFVDPGVVGARVRQNHFGALNPGCGKDGPAAGVIVDGAINTTVTQNTVEGQSNGGAAAGIVVVDDSISPLMAVATGNVVRENTLRANDFDLFVNTTGTGNVFVNNLCSTPQQLCA